MNTSSKLNLILSTTSILFAQGVLAQSTSAKPLRFVLPCSWIGDRQPPVGSPRYQVVKTATKGPRGWENSYSVEVTPMVFNAKTRSFPMVSAGSGDEDYNEYRIVDKTNRSGLGEYAAIQNQFRWASLSNVDGVGIYSCRPKQR